MHCLIFLAVSVTLGLFGALPPLEQSVKELKALVSDSQLQKLLGSGEGIQKIVKTDSGYIVMTQTRLLKVEVEYKSLGHPGPVPFEFHFSQPVDL